jgi:sigma-E factor negative regulatory protein RseA
VSGQSFSGQSREFISALIDDEASEIEIHRLLRDLGAEKSQNDDLKKSFFAFQQVSQVIKQPVDAPAGLSVEQHVALFDRISAAVADEDSYDISVRRSRSWAKPVAGFAVAASLMVAVGVAVITDDGMSNPGALTDVTSPASSQQHSPGQSPMQTQAVSTASTQTALAAENELQPELRELDEDKQRRLREYLNQHDRMSRLNGQSREQMVKYPQSNRK